ncbi:unnamed protein product [Durusdinium trenchii]|uniref:TIR domain-containing protein n=1 Tax=Durusdinium trenchii TaxID=1381693 RepID=A0ABP0L6C9_9DINO
MTLPAHCSVWEGLAVGLTSQSSSSKQKMSCDHVGEPTVMVSHSWSSPYIHLTAILKRYDENTNTNNFFWLDIFSMNQHDFADLSGVQASDPMDGSIANMYDTMLQALTQAIKVPNCMLLALIPHERPALLTRAWCLYEIYIAWKVGAEVACGFVPEAEQSVKKSLLKDDMLINQIIDSVDAKESRATKNSDREMILDLIAEACYEGSLLTNSFSIKVVSVDGDVGIVDLKAVGSSSQQCDGVDFQNSAGSITVENDPGCGLSDYDYSVKYCSDQDKLMVRLVKPDAYDVTVTLENHKCPDGGEV